MSIESIRIRNFRSIREVNFDTKSLTVFVGGNDEGKSNLLRALDLFFNGDKPNGYAFQWDQDFSAFAKTSKNKAPQIDIAITFNLPTFNLKKNIVWHKVWRQSGFFSESITLTNKEELPKRSKAYAYLQSIRYNYVPAIKGPEYFQKLLASIHDMLDATVRKDIRLAANSFTTEIRNHTKDILSDLNTQLGLKSEIQLPTDLRKLFSDLEFRSEAGSHHVALSQRGDGIKVRHIPVILRWLANQANHLSAPGKPRTATIWGYEEPENNLEIKRCFELSNFFIDSSNTIQTFLTTHSPVFYSVFHGAKRDISIMEVNQKADIGTSLTNRQTSNPSDIDSLHSSIGFLELLEPHIHLLKSHIDSLSQRLQDGLTTDLPTIFVEGPSDKAIIEASIKRFFPKSQKVRVTCSSRNGGGHSWVKDSLIAWQHLRPLTHAVGLFDSDEGSKKSIKEFVEIVESRKHGAHCAHKFQLRPLGPALEITKAKLDLPPSIEEICPIYAWSHALTSGWLEERGKLTQLYKFSETNSTFMEWIKLKLADESLRLVAIKRIRDEHKKNFSSYIASEIQKTKSPVEFEPIRLLTESLLVKIKAIEPI